MSPPPLLPTRWIRDAPGRHSCGQARARPGDLPPQLLGRQRGARLHAPESHAPPASPAPGPLSPRPARRRMWGRESGCGHSRLASALPLAPEARGRRRQAAVLIHAPRSCVPGVLLTKRPRSPQGRRMLTRRQRCSCGRVAHRREARGANVAGEGRGRRGRRHLLHGVRSTGAMPRAECLSQKSPGGCDRICIADGRRDLRRRPSKHLAPASLARSAPLRLPRGLQSPADLRVARCQLRSVRCHGMLSQPRPPGPGTAVSGATRGRPRFPGCVPMRTPTELASPRGSEPKHTRSLLNPGSSSFMPVACVEVQAGAPV
jgi:hypothetical protein